jgi:tetratricopeptide (TPR) repeat protein
MRTFSVLLLIVLTFCVCAAASEEVHSKLLADNQASDFPAVIERLRVMQAVEPEKFNLNNYQYLLARSFEANGDIAEAVRAYHALLTADSVLREYAAWRLSQIARFNAEPQLERLYLFELITYFPDSLLAKAANHRIARSYFEGHNYSQAISFLTAPAFAPRSVTKTTKNDPMRRADLGLLANAYLYSGDQANARSIFDRLISETPDVRQPDDIALEGVRGLDMLDGARGIGELTDPLPASEHFRRAFIYQFNRNFAEARAHYTTIVNQFSTDPAAAESTYQIGRGYAAQEQFTESIPWFERVLEQFPMDPIAKDALLQAGSAYTRMGKHREGISRYRQYIDRYPGDERLDRAYLNILDILRDSSEETAALRQAAETQEIFRGKTAEAQALFAEARIYISVEEWEKGLASLDRLIKLPDRGGTRVPGGTTKQEVDFLRGYLLEQLRRYPEAITVYLSLPDGRNEYYGWRASERLAGLYANELAAPAVAAELTRLAANLNAAELERVRLSLQSAVRLVSDNDPRRRMLDSLRGVYAKLPAYSKLPATESIEIERRPILEKQRTSAPANRHRSIAEELMFLGLYDEAAPELEASGELNGSDGARKLARIYTIGDVAHRGVSYAEPMWKSVPADYAVELIPQTAAELLYPAPYRKAISKAAVERSFDPRILLAVMRQESHFRADVKSNAAARGLMQFIPQTSNQIAGELGLVDFEQDDLFDPSTGVLFGSQYIGNLFRMFPNQPDSVVASYNGGESNVRRWQKRAKSDRPERLVPEIAYSQTKDYVYKVMANYRMYMTFYGPDLDQKKR